MKPVLREHWRDINTENIRVVSLIRGLKIEGIVKRRGLLFVKHTIRARGSLVLNNSDVSETY